MKPKKVIEVMRKEKGWHAVLSEIPGKIILARQFGIKSRKYMNRVAHFRPVQKDIRLSLNKSYLGSIIYALKRAGVWPYIMNKSFLRVNTENAKSDKGKVRRELEGLLSKD